MKSAVAHFCTNQLNKNDGVSVVRPKQYILLIITAWIHGCHDCVYSTALYCVFV